MPLLPRSVLPLAVGVVAGALTLGAATVIGTSSPTPLTAQSASHDDGPGDVSGVPSTTVPAPVSAGATIPRSASDGGTTTSTSTPGASTTSSTSPSTTVPGRSAAATTGSVDAAGAGTVTYASDGTTLTLGRATPAAGWSVEVESSTGRELEIDFRSGSRRVQVRIEFEDGAVRERVRSRDDATEADVRVENGVTDDRSDTDDDRSGSSGSDDDSDDDRTGSSGDDD